MSAAGGHVHQGGEPLGGGILSGLGAGSGALLVVDVQRSFADPAHLGDYGLDSAAAEALVAAVSRIDDLVGSARSSGVPVFWIELASDPASPWGSSNWLRGRDPLVMAADEPCLIGTPGAEWYGVRPAPEETRVVKAHYSGFHGTDLDERLKAASVDWVVVAGLTTECCIAATATDAIQNGFPVLVPTDATAAYTLRLHENALEQLALSVARLTTVAELVQAFAASAATPPGASAASGTPEREPFPA